MKKKRRDKKLNKYNESYNNHHLINKTRWWTDVDDNKKKTKVQLHNCLHTLFWNETPAESMLSLLQYFDQVFVDWFKNDLYKVLSERKWVEHKSNTYKWNHIKWWWIKDLLAKWTK